MRPWPLLLGVALLGALWFGPLPHFAPAPFTGHMIVHMGVVAVAAPLIALALVRSRFDPVARAPNAWPPIAASLLELIAVWSWHTPGLHHWARHSHLGFALEQLNFLLCGLWLWFAAFGGEPGVRAERGARAGVAMLLTSMHMTLLGALLALPPRPLYAHPHVSAEGLSPLDDQHLGGAVMLVAGGLVYLLAGLALAVEQLRRIPRAAQRSP